MARGRPPYPDILTPREQEVLDLVREGLTNEQIAERLDISRDGVKYHVSQILSKLGVTSREEAAAWHPGRRPWWATALAPMGWPAAAKAAGLAVVAASATGIGVLVWGVVSTGGPPSEGLVGVASSPTVQATSTPTLPPSGDTPPPAPEIAVIVPSGWQVFDDGRYGFKFSYPPSAQLTRTDAGRARVDLPFAPGTNLAEKFLDVAAGAIEPGGGCSSPLAEGRDPAVIRAETVRINGLPFLRETFGGVATGNIYDDMSYSTVRDGVCVSLSFVLHSGSLGAYPTPPPEFDAAAESAVFLQIASSFLWLQQ